MSSCIGMEMKAVASELLLTVQFRQGEEKRLASK